MHPQDDFVSCSYSPPYNKLSTADGYAAGLVPLPVVGSVRNFKVGLSKVFSCHVSLVCPLTAPGGQYNSRLLRQVDQLIWQLIQITYSMIPHLPYPAWLVCQNSAGQGYTGLVGIEGVCLDTMLTIARSPPGISSTL